MENPQAFPQYTGMYTSMTEGMTLRDYFAGQALPIIEVAPRDEAKHIAAFAYEIADAMLKERSKEKDDE